MEDGELQVRGGFLDRCSGPEGQGFSHGNQIGSILFVQISPGFSLARYKFKADAESS